MICEIFNAHLTLQTMQTKSGQCLYTSYCSLGSGWVLKLTFTFSEQWLTAAVLKQPFSISLNKHLLEVIG